MQKVRTNEHANLTRYRVLKSKRRRGNDSSYRGRHARYDLAYKKRRVPGLRKYKNRMRLQRLSLLSTYYGTDRYGYLRYIPSIAFWNTLRVI